MLDRFQVMRISTLLEMCEFYVYVKWAGHVACMGTFGWKIQKEEISEVLGTDRRIILRWILKQFGGRSLDWINLVQGPVTGFCEHGNETTGPIKSREVFEFATRSAPYTSPASISAVNVPHLWQMCSHLLCCTRFGGCRYICDCSFTQTYRHTAMATTPIRSAADPSIL
jgi:hypothetical protein